MTLTLEVHLRHPHQKQHEFRNSPARRKVIRAGRRSGKTTGIAIVAVDEFLAGGRVLYATPTQEQVERFWFECTRALEQPIEAGIFYKNETRHIIELPHTEQRIRAKTAWNADTLRGDYADLLILDEYQLMKPDAWRLVGAPMLLDNDGDAVFIYTSKRGHYHAKELYKRAELDTTGRWAVFHFSSHDNPHLSKVALDEITGDMSAVNYRLEILAEELSDDPRALWSRDVIDHVTEVPALIRIVVGVDPPGSHEGAECGIVAGGIAEVNGEVHAYILADESRRGTPLQWSSAAVTTYNRFHADRLAAEANFGGEMVERTIRTAPGGENVAYKAVHGSRGKHIRAEPAVSLYERGLVHHVGEFPALEDEMCTWVPGSRMDSPNRLDALVWLLFELKIARRRQQSVYHGLA